MILARTTADAVRCDSGVSSHADAVDEGLSDVRPAGIVMKWNPTLQQRRPKAMTGVDQRRIRLLPTRSIRTRATQVIAKFVNATERDVIVGFPKPRIVKIVAEKYIREFYSFY